MPEDFQRIKIRDERELEDLVVKHPGSIEPGLRPLHHQVHLGRKVVDVLCADDEGAMVVMELKVSEDDDMLVQALEYLDRAYQDRYRLAKAFGAINPEMEPRVLLVAQSFSDRLKRAAKYVEPEVRLLAYSYVEAPGAVKGLICHEVPVDVDEGFNPPVDVKTILETVVREPIRKLANAVIDEIRAKAPGVEIIGAGTKNIYFKHRNRRVATIYARREWFLLKYDAERQDYARIDSRGAWNRVRSKALKIIRRRYESVGGT